MSRFTFSKIFGPWTEASTPPQRAGWYRVRTERLSHSWWNGLAYFDGTTWSEFGQFASMAVRCNVKVLQWQGLALPPMQALELVRANMPTTSSARRSYQRQLQYYFGEEAA